LSICIIKGRRYEGYVTIANNQNNIDNKIQTEKKYASMLPISIRGVICGPSNCGKKRVDKFIEKSWLRERAYSKSLQQSKYRYLEIWHRLKKSVILHFLITAMEFHQMKRFQISFLSSMMWHVTNTKRSESIL